RSGLDPMRGEQARGDRSARARRADRDDGQLSESVRDRGEEPVRHVARAGDVALVALVRLADVEDDDLVGLHQALELVEVDRVEVGAHAGWIDDVAGKVEDADRTEAA